MDVFISSVTAPASAAAIKLAEGNKESPGGGVDAE